MRVSAIVCLESLDFSDVEWYVEEVLVKGLELELDSDKEALELHGHSFEARRAGSSQLPVNAILPHVEEAKEAHFLIYSHLEGVDEELDDLEEELEALGFWVERHYVPPLPTADEIGWVLERTATPLLSEELVVDVTYGKTLGLRLARMGVDAYFVSGTQVGEGKGLIVLL